MRAARGTTLVKLGGSIVTVKRRPRTVRRAQLARLAEELSRGLRRRPRHLVLSHGSGSFGHIVAAEHQIERGGSSPMGISRTQGAAADLHRHVVAALQAAGVATFSFAPSSALVAAGGTPRAVRVEPLLLALRAGLVSVTYGDVVLDRERDGGACICSTETVLLALAGALQRRGEEVRRALWLGDTDGVLDREGELIEHLDGSNSRARARVLAQVGGSGATDVTGGMHHRVETAFRLAHLGIESWIGNGGVPGRAESLLVGGREAGTRVAARRR